MTAGERGRAADDFTFRQVPDGICIAGFVSARRVERWKRWMWECRFRIIDACGLEPKTASGVAMSPDECIGIELPYFVNVPERDRGSLRAKFAQDFRRIVWQLPPRSLRKMKPEQLYGGCSLEVRVGTVETDSGNVVLPAAARYSTIKEILRRVDGTPLYLQRPAPKGAA